MEGKKKSRRRSKEGLYLRGGVWWTRIGGERVSTRCKDKEAARIARARLERIAADPASSASARTTVHHMIAHVLADRKTAKGKTGGVLSPETLEVWRVKLGHFGRINGMATPLSEVTYETVGSFLDQREREGASQHTRSKELSALRFGLRLEQESGNYAYNVDHVTRARRFAVGYKPRKRHLSWEEIPKLLGGILQEDSQRVPMERIEEAKRLRRLLTLKQVADDMQCAVSTVKRYLTMPDPEPTRGGEFRARHAAWIIATGARWAESERAEKRDHDFDAWRVYLRGTKTGAAERTIPIAPPFRALLAFALVEAPSSGEIFGAWSNVNRSLRLACKRASIERVSPNDLRRTHSSLLRQAGVPLEDLAPVMGHKGTRMLELVYGRTNLEALGRSLDKVSAGPSLLPAGTPPTQPTKKGPKAP